MSGDWWLYKRNGQQIVQIDTTFIVLVMKIVSAQRVFFYYISRQKLGEYIIMAQKKKFLFKKSLFIERCGDLRCAHWTCGPE